MLEDTKKCLPVGWHRRYAVQFAYDQSCKQTSKNSDTGKCKKYPNVSTICNTQLKIIREHYRNHWDPHRSLEQWSYAPCPSLLHYHSEKELEQRAFKDYGTDKDRQKYKQLLERHSEIYLRCSWKALRSQQRQFKKFPNSRDSLVDAILFIQ